MIYNSTLNYYEKTCSSCIVYIIFFATSFTISISISSFYLFSFALKKKIYWKKKFIECNSAEHINGKY